MNNKLHKDRGIGASDAPIIMGVSPWKTPYQLWQEKIFGTEEISNFAIERGNALEPFALKCFEEKIGVKLNPQVFVSSPKNKWMTATLDGYDLDKKILVEIKCPGKKDHIVAANKMVPEKYIPQLQHQLEVTGLDSMYYFSFDGKDGYIVEVERNQKYIDKLLNEESEFYNCVINFEPPKLIDADYIDMEDDINWMSLSKEWKIKNSLLKTLEEEEKEIREKLIQLSNNKHAKGGGIKISKSECKGPVDYSKIPQLNKVNLDQYRKKSFTKWRFSTI